jgi:hypothetical protein
MKLKEKNLKKMEEKEEKMGIMKNGINFKKLCS